MSTGPLHVILDTGCRTAVAGRLWHLRFQEYLRGQGLPYEEVKHTEVFRFGAGEGSLGPGIHLPGGAGGQPAMQLVAAGGGRQHRGGLSG